MSRYEWVNVNFLNPVTSITVSPYLIEFRIKSIGMLAGRQINT